MPTDMVTFVQAAYIMPRRHLSISAISQLLLVRFQQNFLDRIFRDQNFFSDKKFVWTKKNFGPKICLWNQNVLDQMFFGPKSVRTKIIIKLKLFLSNFFIPNFLTENVLGSINFGSQIMTQTFFGHKIFQDK